MPFSRQVAKRRLLLHKCMCNNTTLERAREDPKAQVFFSSSSSSRALLGEKRERACGSKPRGRVRPSSGVRFRACQSVHWQACAPEPASSRQHKEKGKGGKAVGEPPALVGGDCRASPTSPTHALWGTNRPEESKGEGLRASPGRQARSPCRPRAAGGVCDVKRLSVVSPGGRQPSK